MAASGGVRYAISSYRLGYLVPLASPSTTWAISPVMGGEWDRFEARLLRYYHYDLYYFNQMFTQLEAYARQHLASSGLYKYIRGIYNPVFRGVNITAAKCYGGTLDLDTLETGAVPMRNLSPATLKALRQVWIWSNFGQVKMRYARCAARYGDGVIKVVDEPFRGRVRLEVLHPGVLQEAEIDAVGHVKSARIEYERLDPDGTPDRPTCIYREEIDQGWFRTYRVKNDQAELYPWTVDAHGTPVAEWPNRYGFVPLVLAQAADIGRAWGATPFHGGVLDKIDQLNDLVSLVFDHLRQAVDVIFYLAGPESVDEVKEGELSGSTEDDLDDTRNTRNDAERSRIAIYTGPEGSQPYPMVAPINFEGALQAQKALQLEIEADWPELAFARLRDIRLDSAPAVRSALGDAIDRMKEFNGNLDAPLNRAFQMAMTIGALGRYQGFEGVSETDYDAGRLDFEIRPREIVLDELTQKERLDFFGSTDAPPRWTWEALGVDEEKITEAEAEQESKAMQVAGEVARVLAGQGAGKQQGASQPNEEEGV